MSKPEQFGPSLPTKEDIIAVFERGDSNDEVLMSMMNLWQMSKEPEADAENKSSLTRISLNLESASLLLQLNGLGMARYYRELAWEMICNEKPPNDEPVSPEFEEIYWQAVDLHYDILRGEEK